ncbi:unnamed protein product [Leptidea sinapis]|uniref:Uncharacterized protein n=1 Tax=Leptidea sinapis TaxID=189913 RepID=A0A5E4QME2_9NEOP|nr:unnamed protein product [Leptidea sinapis]
MVRQNWGEQLFNVCDIKSAYGGFKLWWLSDILIERRYRFAAVLGNEKLNLFYKIVFFLYFWCLFMMFLVEIYPMYLRKNY